MDRAEYLASYCASIDCTTKNYRDCDLCMYAKGRADCLEECIDKFAEIMSNMHQICGRSCPVNCNWGTTTSCKDKCKKWLKEQLKEQKNG